MKPGRGKFFVKTAPPAGTSDSLILDEFEVEDLAGLLEDLYLWLSQASTRTLRELADHIDRCWSYAAGSRDVYAAGFIARLQRCRKLLDLPTLAR